MITRWLEPLITFVYPATCRRCKNLMGLSPVPYICDKCWAEIECLKPPWCQRCGIPFDVQGESLLSQPVICVDCHANPPLYGKLRTTAFYEPTLREAIHLLKYDKKPILAKHLVQLMQQHLPDDSSADDYDFLLPIPLHRSRYRSRGFNQSEYIAKGISGVWNLPVRDDVLLRIRDTVPQSSLNSHAERVKNIAGAFEVRSPTSIRDQRILLIDDIFTTGTTINEAIRVLQPENPRTIDVLVLSRTRPPEGSRVLVN